MTDTFLAAVVFSILLAWVAYELLLRERSVDPIVLDLDIDEDNAAKVIWGLYPRADKFYTMERKTPGPGPKVQVLIEIDGETVTVSGQTWEEAILNLMDAVPLRTTQIRHPDERN